MKLWYDKPASKWSEALPVGNGMIGGMIYGDPLKECIKLNEDSIWNGGFITRDNPDALKYLPEIRRFIREGKIAEAERIARYALSGVPNSQRSYQTAGECYFSFHNEGEVKDYRRELDLDKGIVKISYRMGTTCYRREIFCSYPDQVMVIRMKAEGPEKLNFDCHLERNHNWSDETVIWETGSVGFSGNSGKEGIDFFVGLHGEVINGKMKSIGEHLIIEDAEEVIFYLSIATDYRYGWYRDECIKRIKQAVDIGYEKVRERHIEDYQQIFHQFRLELESENCFEQYPTDVRLENLRKGNSDTGLMTLYVQYGRYLLISSSREGSLPANLQGIWNDSMTPPWDSKFTININLQMNYWLADTGNLTECYMPYFELLDCIKERGKKTAETMYGCHGSVAHHNTDLYGDSAPQDYCVCSTHWVMGEAWLATHIWDHYCFTKDQEFLEKYFDVLEQCVTFFKEFLVEKSGSLVVSPTISPENSYILPNGSKGCLCEGATMDTEILRELFGGYIEACKVLGKEEKLSEAENTRKKLPEYKIGKWGQLQEWLEDYDEVEPGHRHISHLFCIYPGTGFSWPDTPELLTAARKTLERRLENGGGHTGWSRAWIMGLWARFGEGEKAYHNFRKLLCNSTFDNLMDNHPYEGGAIFQIDGNMGAAAAVIEMLVQSHNGRVQILPALPEAFTKGSVFGIRLRGGSVLDMMWNEGKVTCLKIYSEFEQEILLEMEGRMERIHIDQKTPYIYGESGKF